MKETRGVEAVEKPYNGSIFDNGGYWYLRVKLPGDIKRRAFPLCAPGSNKAMRTDRPRKMAIEAAQRLWENAKRRERYNPAGANVEEVCDAYLEYARVYYRHGTEVANIKAALRMFRSLYGRRPINELVHSDALKIRQGFINMGLARVTINRHMFIICSRMMGWAFDAGLASANARNEMMPPVPLKRGRCEAKESVPVKSVPADVIEATVAHMVNNTADMVRVHALTGMRPSELCDMRWCDIDRTSEPWVYRPAKHKNDWRGEFGQPRVILIGPKARAILLKYKGLETEYPFSPITAVAEHIKELREKRTSPFYPCRDENYTRAKEQPSRKPREKWDATSYNQAIEYACKKAGIEKWSPNQLRHTFATQVRRRFGLEACRAVLGHSMRASVTDRYSFEALEDEIILKASTAVEALG